MKTTRFLGMVLVFLCTAGALRAVPIAHAADYDLDLGLRLQFLANGQIVNDPYAQHNRLYMFMKESRLMFNGRYLEEIMTFS